MVNIILSEPLHVTLFHGESPPDFCLSYSLSCSLKGFQFLLYSPFRAELRSPGAPPLGAANSLLEA